MLDTLCLYVCAFLPGCLPDCLVHLIGRRRCEMGGGKSSGRDLEMGTARVPTPLGQMLRQKQKQRQVQVDVAARL